MREIVKEIIGNAVIRNTKGYNSLTIKIMSAFSKSGYYVSSRSRTNKFDDFEFRCGKEVWAMRTLTSPTHREGCSAKEIHISVGGETVVKRTWYCRDIDTIPPFSGKEPMWENIGDAAIAKKKRCQRLNHLQSGTFIVKTIEGNKAERLQTARGHDIVSIVRRHDGFEDVGEGDILSVKFIHSDQKTFVELTVTVYMRNRQPLSWKSTRSVDILRYERRQCRGKITPYRGELIPDSLFGKGTPWSYTFAIVSESPSDSENITPVGYFLANSDLVYGFTYAVTDKEGRLLLNGYNAKNIHLTGIDNYFCGMERFVKELIEKNECLSCLRDASFSTTPLPYRKSAAIKIPLNITTALTYPFGTDKGCTIRRDLSDISAEEWNAQRHFIRDGGYVYICGDCRKDGYRWCIEKADSETLVLRWNNGDTTISFHKDSHNGLRGTFAFHSQYNQWEWDVILTPSGEDDIMQIMRSFDGRTA